MPPDSVIIAGVPANEADPCTKTDGSGAIKELRIELRAMHGAVKPFLTSDARVAYWSQVWELEVIRASLRVESNRKQTYSFRLTAISSAIIVPSLVALNLSGTGGTAVRWLTFSLSLVAALSTAILTLFRFGNRWLMYRSLSNELINAGWAMVNSPHTDLDKPWSAFTAATSAAISRYNISRNQTTRATAEPSTPRPQPAKENGDDARTRAQQA